MQSSLSLGARSAFRSAIFALVSSSPLALSTALAQQAAEPAATLDPITVEGQQKKKAKQAKSKAKTNPVAKAAPTAPTQATDEVAETAEPPSGTGKATKPGLNLDNPNTGGSRLGLTPLQTPASIEVISGDTARERGQGTVVEAVTQNAAGITSVSSAGNGDSAYVSRGFSGSNSVAQFFDGTKLYVVANTVTFPFNTWSADRIEVLRGPASVLYGDGAIGGIVNVVPKKPTDTFVNEAEFSLGSDWSRRISLGSGGPINDKLAYRFDVTGSQSEGWLDHTGEFADAGVSGALRYKAAPGLTFTLSNDFGYREPMNYWGTPLINGKLDNRLRFKNFNVRDAEIEHRDNWTQLKAEWQVNDALTLRNVAYRLKSDRHWKEVEEYYYNPGPGTVTRESYLEIFHDVEQWGDRFDATLRHSLFGLPTQTVVGFDVNRVDLTYTDNFNQPFVSDDIDPFDFEPGNYIAGPATPSFRNTMEQYALFAETRVELTKQLSVIGGIRFDRPDIERVAIRAPRVPYDVDFAATTWRAGAVYELAPGLALYGQYSTAIDPVDSLMTLSTSQANLELTTGRQVEAGIKQSFWNGRAEWTLAAYDIVKENLLVPVTTTTTLQVGQQSSRGIEFSLAARLSEALRVEGNIALLQAEYDEFNQNVGGTIISRAGNRPINVPETVANFWLSYRFLPRWEARAGVQYVGERFSDTANERELPDYAVVNAGLDFDVTHDSTLSLRGYNVFDEVYPVTAYGPNWVLGRPRSADLTYRIKF